MPKRRRQGMAGSILEQFAELKSDYEIGKASRYKRTKTGIMTLGSHADYHYRTESAYFGAMEMAREMTRNNPLVMQGVRRLVAHVVGRGFVLDSDSGDKAIDDVNGYRWAEWSRSPEACDDQQELDFHGLERLTLQHVIIDGDICSLPNRDGAIESQEGHRLKTPAIRPRTAGRDSGNHRCVCPHAQAVVRQLLPHLEFVIVCDHEFTADPE